MSELEKRPSDFQVNECDTLVVEEPIDERLCPECTPNPHFTLEDKWYFIKESYLNEKFCEYHVAIYRGEEGSKDYLENEDVIKKGVEKLLIDLDKLLNNETRKSLELAANIVEFHYDPVTQSKTGEACLVAVPSFNFDSIPEQDEGDDDDRDGEETVVDEAIVDYKDLFKKTVQLGGSLRVYGLFMAHATNLKKAEVNIRYKENPSQRLHYPSIRKSLIKFRKKLNVTLRANGYEGIDYPSLIRKKYKKIKFVYKPNDPYVIKNIYVLDENCDDEYTKLLVNDQDLKGPGFKTINYFMANLDSVMNDITAQETKPWLEFTIDNIYPRVVVDYGEIDSISEEDFIELGCLFEKSLGIGNGQVTDYLAKETLSFFKSIENEMYKSACRSINQVAAGGPEAEQLKRQKTQFEERKERQEAIYKRQYIEEMYGKLIDFIKGSLSAQDKVVDKNNVFTFVSTMPGSMYLKEPEYDYKPQDAITGPTGETIVEGDSGKHSQVISINSKTELESAAIKYAQIKFERLDRAWGTRFKNNPDWEEMKESYAETWNDKNLFLDLILGRENEDTDKPAPTDSAILNTIGLCGMTKMTGKILKCLLAGVTIEDFYDLLIEKTLEQMNINIFALFFNGLPLSFREELNSTIEAQFGGASFTDLINMKTQEPGSLQDICSFSAPDRIMKIFERYSDPLSDDSITRSDQEFVKGNIGEGEFYESIRDFYSNHYDKNENVYKAGTGLGFEVDDEKVVAFPPSLGYSQLPTPTEGKKKKYSSMKKYAKKFVKHSRRSYLKGLDTFAAANNKSKNVIKNSKNEPIASPKQLNAFERANKGLQTTNIGTKVDAVYDVIFDFTLDYIADSLNADFLVEQLANFPGADLAFGFVSDFLKSCPHPPLFNPPAGDFMKSFSLDVCDPELSLKIPKINFPSLSFRYNIEKQFGEIFRQAITELIVKIAIGLLKRVLTFLEDAFCKTLQALGTPLQAIGKGVEQGNVISGFKDNFEKALDDLFCGGSTNPETGNSRASELSNGLFMPSLSMSSADYEGAGKRVSNIISSVLSQSDILNAVVNGDENANKLVANAISVLSPEMRVLLGSPDQVAIFFNNLRSYLPSEDQQRIRDMLEAGVPNLPMTASICLSNNQLKAWNDLRKGLLQDLGLTPEQAADKVNALNQEVLDELEKTISDNISLDSPDGPFIGAITDEALKDACNPKNLFNDVSDNELSKIESDELTEQYFNILLRIMMISFNGRNGVLGNALRDRDGNREGVLRRTLKFFNPNYMNSQEERQSKYTDRSLAGQFIMDQLTDKNDDGVGNVKGDYPTTVAIYLRSQLLENITFENSEKMKLMYTEGISSTSNHYTINQNFVNLDRSNTFDYNLNMIEKIDVNQVVENKYGLYVQNNLTKKEISYLESIGIFMEKNSSNLRKTIFDTIVKKSNSSLNSIDGIYEKVFQSLMLKVVESSVTNKNNTDYDMLPNGFLFGYVSEDIKESDFVYLNPRPSSDPYDEETAGGQLGHYAHDRIRVLSPELYGGRYTNPPFTVEPRRFNGWVEYATKAFESGEGCDPKRPAMLSLLDIKERVKYLEKNIRNYADMSKDKECVTEVPFKLLISSKARAKMDGVVRSTIRAYMGEYFLKGIGVFSNVHYRPENYDKSLPSYISYTMKQEMMTLGPLFPVAQKRIAYERYWYTFLEQAVQSYQTMYDLREVSPPAHVLDAMETISEMQAAYSKITANSKKAMRKFAKSSPNRPSLLDRKSIISKPAQLAVYGMDFRVSEEKEDYFDSGPISSKVNSSSINVASIRKVELFAKALAIKMYEKEAMTIMSELILMEAARLSENAFEGLSNKPLIFDLNKAFIGLSKVFPNSDSMVGLNSYYLKKQEGTENPGDVPDLSTFVATEYEGEDIEFVVEKYVRSIPKNSNNTASLVEELSTLDFKSRIQTLRSQNPGTYLSDYFGDLEFAYEGSILNLFEKGFANQASLTRLWELNGKIDALLISMQNKLNSYISGKDFDDIQVIYDSSFLLEGENVSPSKTIGSLGIKYGLKISCIIPINMSPTSSPIKLELMKTEVEAMDTILDSYSISKEYDLECLINKMADSPEFTIMFNKVLPIKMMTSAAAIFCIENFMKSLGEDETERSEAFIAKKNSIFPDGIDDDWEGVMNEILKNYLRREFASTYMNNDRDGFSFEGLSERERARLFGSFNPFDIFALPSVKIPWFKKRRLKTKVYDAFGNECAAPEKDFE